MVIKPHIADVRSWYDCPVRDHDVLDVSSIPVYEVDFEALELAKCEDEFLRISFELLREAGQLLSTIAGAVDEQHLDGFTRNEAILVGHIVRMTKLIREAIADIANCHGGDQQSALVRQFLDSMSTLKYLLENPLDQARFDAYVFDSLIAEKEFLKEVRRQIQARGGQIFDIEERIVRSIELTFETAGVTEDEIPSRKDIGWPNAQTRLAPFGPEAYSAYRTGSGAIHGSWYNLERNHLELIGDKFHPNMNSAPERPQPLFVMGLGVAIAKEYIDKCIPAARSIFDSRLDDFLQRLARVGATHEGFLARRRAERPKG